MLYTDWNPLPCYFAEVKEISENHIFHFDEYVFDPASHSVEFKVSGKTLRTIPLSDPKYISVTIYDLDRVNYLDPIDTFLGGGPV